MAGARCSASSILASGCGGTHERSCASGRVRVRRARRRGRGGRRRWSGRCSRHDFSIKYVADNNARVDAAALHDHRAVGRARRLDPAVGADPRRLPDRRRVKFRARATDPLVAWATLIGLAVAAVLLRADAGRREPVHTSPRCAPVDGQGPNPLLQNHPLMAFHPPMLYLGLRRVHRPVRVRDRRADHRALRRGVARRHAPGDARRVGLPDRRHHPRRVVELRGARLGRLLGVGPGGERVAAAVAHRHRVHPLGDRAGTARHAARLEPVARHRDVLPHDPRHVPHPLGRHRLGARVHAVATSGRGSRRSSPSSPRWAVGLIAWRGDRLRAPGRIDSPVSRESAFLAQQPALRGARARRAARHRLPAAGRSAARPAPVGGRAVLRPDDDAARPRAAVPHGRGAGIAVARDERRRAAPPPARPRVGRRPHDGGRRSCSACVASPTLLDLRPRRVRDRRDRPPVRTRRARPATASGERGPSASTGTVRGNPRLYGGLVVHLGVVLIAVALAASSGVRRPTRGAAARRAVGDGRRLPRHVPGLDGAVTGAEDHGQSAGRASSAAATTSAPTHRRSPRSPNSTEGIGTPSVHTGAFARRVPHAAVVADQRGRVTIGVRSTRWWCGSGSVAG